MKRIRKIRKLAGSSTPVIEDIPEMWNQYGFTSMLGLTNAIHLQALNRAVAAAFLFTTTENFRQARLTTISGRMRGR
ncbi:MAG TPA: hypothetical protein PLL75_01280 [Candidatus Omnitrophota bacterium]|nr:hypothetical protein [Candidatus Omnitrophota bacterium]HPS36346.1 hypothetical protein [Candidatus Omnitrophota bacterium]